MQSSDHQILPALVNFVEKLDHQLYHALQNLEQSNIEYLYRLRDECELVKLCDSIMEQLSKYNEQEKIAKVGLIKLEHIYYKTDSLYERTKAALKNKPEQL